jgi:pantoate--beta-alanine ligase
MKIFNSPTKLQLWCRQRSREGKLIALVPTMGYLHEGHLSLIKRAKQKGADEIVVSIFVNPVQFCPGEDYEKYPRDEMADLEKCRAAGATAVFLPTPKTMYLDHHSVYVVEEELSLGYCGARRPGHFRGVCTVVAKLFNIVRPDIAVFGQKDYQQAMVIKRMVRDLNFGIKIDVAPIVRESSGLAKSSRNTYLSDEERKRASVISAALKDAKAGRLTSVAEIKRAISKAGLKVDYVECVDAQSLVKRRKIEKGSAILVAAWCGKTRLLDNCKV